MTATQALRFVAYLERFIGKPYRFGTAQGGGDDPVQGFDCSGLTSEGLRAFGVIGPRERLSAQMIHDRFKDRTADEMLVGDLLFFGKDKAHITHVAIAYGNGQMLEAGGGASETDTIPEASAANAFVRLRPVKARGDMVAFLRIFKEA